MLNFCDFIQGFVFTTNHRLKVFKNVLIRKDQREFLCAKI